MVDFRESDALAQYRADARAWVDANTEPEWVETQLRTGTYHTPELHARMAEAGVLGAGWPREYGGSDVDEDLALAITQELGGRGFRLDGWITTEMVLRTVLAVGTEEQKQEWVSAGLRGEMVIVLGYTEPGSGSDAAAAAMRAIPDGDQWVINGTKMFTSTAHLGTHVFLLTRSNTEVRKHRGLTMFMAPLSADGVEIQPIHTLGGQRTNATYYRDVRVPDTARVGGIDDGWNVMRVALVHERSVAVPPAGPSLVERAAQWAQATTAADGRTIWEDAVVRDQLARMTVDIELSRIAAMKNRWATTSGRMTGVEGAISKLISAESNRRHLETILDIGGPEAVLTLDYARHAEASNDSFLGEAEKQFRTAVVSTVYGGSTEMMREIVADRHLGLPKARPLQN